MLKNKKPTEFGYSEVDITPDRPVELVGFHRAYNTSKGILHNLKAQTLVCGSNSEKCCLIAIDSIGFTVELTNKLRDLVCTQILSCLRKALSVMTPLKTAWGVTECSVGTNRRGSRSCKCPVQR